MRILAVDDDPVMLDLLAATLTEADGYTLESHSSAESGLEALDSSEQPFDCVLLDIMLPGMDGVEMCGVIRQSGKHASTPVLMITGLAEIGLMSRAFEAGATDFIHKPFDPNELIARVKMTSLLSQSLAKSNQADSDPDAPQTIAFEDAVDLAIEGITSPLALENDLLRCRAECFAMSMFKIDFFGLRGIHRAVDGASFESCLKTLGETAVDSFKGQNFKLSYFGGGRFIVAFMSRQRFYTEELDRVLNLRLAEAWNAERTAVPSPPTAKFKELSSKRLWSGVSASDAIRGQQIMETGIGSLTAAEEIGLFARLDDKLCGRT